MKTVDKKVKECLETLRISGVSYNRIVNNGSVKHTITLHIVGEIPPLGLGAKKIRKMIKEYYQ